MASHLLASRQPTPAFLGTLPDPAIDGTLEINPTATPETLITLFDDETFTTDSQSFKTLGKDEGIANVRTETCGLWSRCRSRARSQSNTLPAPLSPRQDISDLTNIPNTEGSGFEDPDLGQGPPPTAPAPQTHPKACSLWNWRSCSGWWFSKRSPPNTHLVVARQETDPSTSPPVTTTHATTSDSNESSTSTNRDPKPWHKTRPKAGVKNKAWDLWGRDEARSLGKRDPGVTGPRTKKGAWSLWGNGNSRSRARGLNGVEVRQEGEDTEVGGWIDEPEVKEGADSLWRNKFWWWGS